MWKVDDGLTKREKEMLDMIGKMRKQMKVERLLMQDIIGLSIELIESKSKRKKIFGIF